MQNESVEIGDLLIIKQKKRQFSISNIFTFHNIFIGVTNSEDS